MAGSCSSASIPSSFKSQARSFAKGDKEKAIGPTEMKEISDEMRSVVWIINVTVPGPNRRKFCYLTGTGFCIHPEGYIFTAAHVFPDNFEEIEIRKYDDDDFRSSEDGHVRLVKKVDSFDIALLKVEICREGDRKGFSYAALGNSELFVGQDVIAITHPLSWIYTTARGEIAYPCVKDIEQEEDPKLIKDVNVKKEILRTGWFCTPAYRKARDIIHQKSELNYLRTDVPLIQINNSHGLQGSSGGPFFDSCGHVVGMLIFNGESMNFGVHVKALKDFYQKYVEKDMKKVREKEKEDKKRRKEKRSRSTRG